MLRFFRYNSPFVIILLMLLCVGLHIVAYIYPESLSQSSLNQDVASIFRKIGISHYMSLVLSNLFILVQGLLFQRIIRKHEVLYKLSYLPATLYIMICSAFIEQLILTPQLIINFFLIVILDNVFKLHKTEKPFETIFNCGFLLGVCTLISIELSILFLMLLFSLNYFRPFSWKENMSLVLSYMLPFYFAGSIFYLADEFDSFRQYYLHTGWLRFNMIEQAKETRFLVIASLFAFTLLLGFFRLNNNFMKNTIKSRKSQFVVGVMLVLGILVISANGNQFYPNFTLLALPLSLFTAYYFIDPRPRIFKEVLFLSLLAWIIYFQWKPYF